MTHQPGTLYAGTSGWSYRWDEFYPSDLPSREYLPFYSRQFRTVEVNYSFYHFPRSSTYQKWASQTPADFVFAVKLNRTITHNKRLSGAHAELEKFLTDAATLGSRLGPILVQLPPSLKIDLTRLDEFLSSAQKAQENIRPEGPLRIAVEFRHQSWFDHANRDALVRMLTRHHTAFVYAHSNRFPYPETEPVTADFVYLRLHGPEQMFASVYGKEKLMRWVPRVTRWLDQGLDVYFYFNNDVNGYAVSDARELLRLVSHPLL